MARMVAQSPLSNVSTSVVDLSFLVVVALMTLGQMLSLLQRLQPPAGDTAPPPAVADLRTERDALAQELTEARAELERARLKSLVTQQEQQAVAQQIEQATEETNRLEVALATRTAEKEQLEKLVAEQEAGAQDTVEMLEIVGERDRHVRELEQKRNELVRTQDRLQQHMAAQVKSAKNQSGVGIVRPASGDGEGIIIRKATIFPVNPGAGFVDIASLGNITVITPKGGGLTVEEALRPGSALMHILSPDPPARVAWVLCLVDQQSFGTFRALRAGLSAKKLRVGWEPWNDERVILSPEGRRAQVPDAE